MGIEGGRGDPPGPGVGPGRVSKGAAAGGRPWPLGGPPGRPSVSGSFLANKIPRKFPCNSENISKSRFSEIENNKNRALARGILSIG